MKNSIELLSRVYSNRREDNKLAVFTHETRGGRGAIGGILSYLALENAHIGLGPNNHPYTQELLEDDPFATYIFSIFGKPEVIQKLDEDSKGKFSDSPVIATHYNPEVVTATQDLETRVQDVYYYLNNKVMFQGMVSGTIGTEYTTNSIIVDRNKDLSDIISNVETLLKEKGEVKIVVRIADSRVAPGGGMGVVMANSIEEVESFFKNVDNSHYGGIEIFSDMERHKGLQSEVLIEQFIPNSGSPSISFFLAEDGPSFLGIGRQVLYQGAFLAGTNMLPPHFEMKSGEIIKKGYQLAQAAWDMGARGFIGFDMVLPLSLKKTHNSVLFLECNYRETGTTIPAFNSLRASNFTLDHSEVGWAFVLNAVRYSNNIPDFPAALAALRSNLSLFEGRGDTTNLDVVKTIPLYGMQKNGFDLVFFWERKQLSSQKAEQQVNEIILNLNNSQSFPKIKINHNSTT